MSINILFLYVLVRCPIRNWKLFKCENNKLFGCDGLQVERKIIRQIPHSE